MSFVVSCQCGKQYRVADEQLGKKTRCKGCGAVLRLVPDDQGAEEAAPPPPPPPPPVPEDHDPFADVDWSTAAGPESAPPPPPRSASAPLPSTQTSAPRQMVTRAPAKAARPLNYASAAAAAGPSSDSDLTTGDWLLCIFCGTIACILGIVYLVQGKPKGGKMILISFIVSAIAGAVKFAIRQSVDPGQP